MIYPRQELLRIVATIFHIELDAKSIGPLLDVMDSATEQEINEAGKWLVQRLRYFPNPEDWVEAIELIRIRRYWNEAAK